MPSTSPLLIGLRISWVDEQVRPTDRWLDITQRGAQVPQEYYDSIVITADK